VTGGSGWLAQRTIEFLCTVPSLRVLRTYRTGSKTPIPEGVKCLPFDFTDENEVDAFLSIHSPSVVVHLGALTNVLACHNEPQKAIRTNCPNHLITRLAALHPNCKFLFASTDLVYPGTSPPYLPLLPRQLPRPLNQYAQTKLDGETLALESLANTTILRLSNMIARGGGKFLEFLLMSMHSRLVIGLREDERRSFVARDDVARLIVALASTQDTGLGQVFNVGGPDGLSRLQLAELVAESTGVTLPSSADYKKRPRCN